MTLKQLIAPALILASLTLWYCQKSPQVELDSLSKATSNSSDREGCMIQNPGPDPMCNAQVRVRCISAVPGVEVFSWSFASRWYTLQNGMANFFNFYLNGGFGGAEQQGVWYNIPQPVLKQSLLNTCPGNHGNNIILEVYSGGASLVTQWSAIIDVKSGNRITSYFMNGATGVLTPTGAVWLPETIIITDESDVDFLGDCSNMGAQGVLCNPFIGCAECSTGIGDDKK